MSLEAGTYVSDLNAAQPPGTDQKKQGDDHLRLIKSVLKATFPNADRAWRMPEFSTKSSVGSIATTDENKTLLCNTSGGSFTLTLPTPTFDGWAVRVMKTTTDTNVVFVAPPSGNINTEVGAVAKIRIGVPYKEHTFLWTGSAFIELDPFEPVGTTFNFYGSTVPVGYGFVYGQTLVGTSADYPKLYAVRSSLVFPDVRGRVEYGKDNMDGADAGRLTELDGDTLGAVGGAETQTITQANLPNVTLTFTSTDTFAYANDVYSVDLGATSTIVKTLTEKSVTGNTSSLNGGVTQTAIHTLPPGIVCNKIMRLC